MAELIITIGPEASATAMMRGVEAEPEDATSTAASDHRRRHQEQDVGGDDLLHQTELGDHRGEDEPDAGADGEAAQELVR